MRTREQSPSHARMTSSETIAEDGGAKTVRMLSTDGSTRFNSETTEGADYATIAQQSIVIKAGAASGYKDVSLTPTRHEGSETIAVTGSLSTLTVTDATIAITDDDGAPIGLTSEHRRG